MPTANNTQGKALINSRVNWLSCKKARHLFKQRTQSPNHVGTKHTDFCHFIQPPSFPWWYNRKALHFKNTNRFVGDSGRIFQGSNFKGIF